MSEANQIKAALLATLTPPQLKTYESIREAGEAGLLSSAKMRGIPTMQKLGLVKVVFEGSICKIFAI